MKNLFNKARQKMFRTQDPSIRAAVQEFEEISARINQIREEDRARSLRALVSLLDDQNVSSNQDFSIRLRDAVAMTALLCLRIEAACQLIQAGFSEKREELEKDLEELFSQARTVEQEWQVSANVRRDVYDLLGALCSEKHREILQKSYPWNQNAKAKPRMNKECYDLFTKVSGYLEEMGRIDLSHHLLEVLCTYSRERSTEELHRWIVHQVLLRLTEKDPDKVCRIGAANEDQFEKDRSVYAGDFYWFYGIALQQKGDLSAAADAFQTSYELRKEESGDADWYTALARKSYAVCVYFRTGNPEEKDVLQRFVDQMEAGMFDQDVDLEQRQLIEAETLYCILWDVNAIEDLDLFRKKLDRYKQLCQKYGGVGNPLISMRLFWNIKGAYDMCREDYMQAEMAFKQALKMDSDASVSVLGREQIQTNLLLSYLQQNDREKEEGLLEKLLDGLDGEKTTLGESDQYRVKGMAIAVLAQRMVGAAPENLSQIQNWIIEICEDMEGRRASKLTREKVVVLLSGMMYLLQQKPISTKDCIRYLQVLNQIRKMGMEENLFPAQKVILYECESAFLWKTGNCQANVSFQRAIQQAEKSRISSIVRENLFSVYAEYLLFRGNTDTALFYLEKTLNEVTKIWQSSVCYLNDSRLLSYLSQTNLIWGNAYAMLRTFTDVKEAYEQVLNFKMLASLAGRERNRILHQKTFDYQAVDRIRRLQNAIAMLETESRLRGVEREYIRQEEQLRKLEADFAMQFPETVEFMEITWDAVQQAIPDHTAILEYVLTFKISEHRALQPLFSREVSGEESLLDLYLTVKEKGVCRLERITIPQGEAVMADAEAFVRIMQRKIENRASFEEMEQFRAVEKRLHGALIQPVLELVRDCETIYFAPDYELLNLPLELLGSDTNQRLADEHHCVKIECARDFLFHTTAPSSDKGSLIMGDPAYEVKELVREEPERKKEKDGFERTIPLKKEKISPLPFSRIEAEQVYARRSGRLYLGKAAKKETVLSATGYSHIHIATHGYFEEDAEETSLYSSGLLFAGAQNWLEKGTVNPVYGNGIVTADEISRMDLSSTNLVVLSSCLSGRNDITWNAGFHGMISAFSAAGVRYVISNLWSVDDLASAVFMDQFYASYENGRISPPQALATARNYLRTVTVDQLRERGWFTASIYQKLGLESREFLRELEERNGRWKPFKNEAYWSGFTCYECWNS